MKKIGRWLGVGLVVVVGLLVVLSGVVYFVSEARMNATYTIEVEAVPIPTGATAVAYGKHVATIRNCIECHGENLAGKIYLEDPTVGRIVTSNLTSGKNGVGSSYTDSDYIRAIRHGVGSDGKPLVVMPAHELYYLSDADLGAVIAYVKSLPPVDSDLPPMKIALLLRAIYLFTDQVPLVSAEVIDHTAARPVAPAVGVTAEYGDYLSVNCRGCHGQDLAGGPVPGAPPSWPPSLNLTPGGELRGWSEADFMQTMRTGVTPNGRPLANEYMPWQILGVMTDDELKAVWLYVQSVPAKEQGD